MTFILFSWASLATICAFGFCLWWRVEVAIHAKTPRLMSQEDVEAALQAARELTADEIPALAATLVLPASKPQPTWTGHQCSLPGCTETAVVRWVGGAGKTWYDCSLHWEYERNRFTVSAFETLT